MIARLMGRSIFRSDLHEWGRGWILEKKKFFFTFLLTLAANLIKKNKLTFRRFGIIAKSSYCIGRARLSVFPSAYISGASTGRISVIFYIVKFI